LRNVILFCLLVSLVFSFQAIGQVYKWMDERGVVHYGDRPTAAQETTTLKINEQKMSDDPMGQQPKSEKHIGKGWDGCQSRSCVLGQTADPRCDSSLCSEARAIDDNCITYACQMKRHELRKHVEQMLYAQKLDATSAKRREEEQQEAAAFYRRINDSNNKAAEKRVAAECGQRLHGDCNNASARKKMVENDLAEQDRARTEAANRRIYQESNR
jgi:hypothetical protein